LPTPPCAVGSVHAYQSVAVFMSSIWVAAVATPNRHDPLPASPPRLPIVEYPIAFAPSSPPHATSTSVIAISLFTGRILPEILRLDTRDRIPILPGFAMAKLPPYAVLVRELPTHRTFEVSPEQVSEWVRGLPMRDALHAPEVDPDAGSGVADLDLYADGTHAFATGTFKGHVTVACSRCVEPVKLQIDEKLLVTFLPASEIPEEDATAPAGEDGAEVDTGDLDVFPFDGEKIDLEPLFREQFVLAIPFAPLCREDCKGLCPQCGIDRNTSTCTCEKPIDPRLAALKGLKLPS
jgi:uncharacterized protein